MTQQIETKAFCGYFTSSNGEVYTSLLMGSWLPFHFEFLEEKAPLFEKVPYRKKTRTYVTSDYAVYGKSSELIVSQKSQDNPVTEQFTTKEADRITGFMYFGARYYDAELGLWGAPDPANQFFSPYAYVTDPVNYVDPDGRIAGWDDLVVGVIGAGISYVSGGLNEGDWLNGQALFNVYNGASSAVAGYNVGLVTTAATGGCFVCGFAAGSLAGSTVSSVNNNLAHYATNGQVGNNTWTAGVGPASYTFNGPNSGFNIATFEEWDSPASVFNNTLTGLSYVSTATSAYGTYGAYRSGSLFNEQWTTPMQIKAGTIRANQAASTDVLRASNWVLDKTGLEFKFQLGTRNIPQDLSYPPGDGSLNGGNRNYQTVLKPGTQLQRYGDLDGYYLSPKGTPFEKLSLRYPPSNSPTSLQVLKPFRVNTGLIEPYYGQQGLGTQYVTPYSIQRYINKGYLGIQ